MNVNILGEALLGEAEAENRLKSYLQVLQRDDRISNLELAEAVGLSPTPCSRRVRRLEESGLIRAHVALLNQSMLGLKLTAFIGISMDRHTPDRFEAFEDLDVTAVTGPYRFPDNGRRRIPGVIYLVAGALTVGCVVAIAASIAGDTSQDLKTGYLLGATPYRQQLGEMVGVLTSATFVCLTVLALGKGFGFGSTELPAPQATLMKLVIDGYARSAREELVEGGASMAADLYSNMIKKLLPSARSTSARRPGWSPAQANSSSSSAIMTLEKALCFSGRFKVISSRVPQRSTRTAGSLGGGPRRFAVREASQAPNSASTSR